MGMVQEVVDVVETNLADVLGSLNVDCWITPRNT